MRPLWMCRGWLTFSLLLAGLAHAPLPVGAATFVVDSIADSSDGNTGDGVCADAGGNCSLRAAIEQANATAEQDQIEFAIAGLGPHIIRVTSGLPLPVITSALHIDGYTQPGASANTSLTGTNARIEVEIEGDLGGLFLTYTGLEVLRVAVQLRGLAIRGFSVGVAFTAPPPTGNSVFGSALLGSRVEQCGTGVWVVGNGVRIGGVAMHARNLISNNQGDGVDVEGSANFVTNNLIGTDASGTNPLGNFYGVLLLSGSNHAITDNVISGNGIGVGIGPDASANTLVRNRIGLSADGRAPLGNLRGIDVQGTQNQIGLPSVSRSHANRISANGTGLTLTGDGNIVQGNEFGTGGIGAGGLGNDEAIVIYSSDNVIGAPVGITPNGHGNLVAFSTIVGISLSRLTLPFEASRNSLRANRVFANPFDIDLGTDGVINNDLGDLDTGPNGLQNPPTFDQVTVSQGSIQIEGKLDALPGSYTLDFFSSAACDGPPDTGSGEFYLGSADVLVGAGGATFSTALSTTALGHGFSAMATAANGNSSELGPCFDATVAGAADLSVGVATNPGGEVDPGDAVSVEVTVENAGPATATNVPVAIARPPGFASWSSSGPGSYDDASGVWSVGDLAPGASATRVFDATIDASAAGPLAVAASAEQGLGEPDPDLSGNQSSASFDVRSGADLVLTQSTPASALPGALVAINIAVRNDGPEDATGVMLSGQLDANLDIDAATAPAGLTFNSATRRWTLPLGDLAEGETAQVVLNARVAAASVLGSGLKQTVITFAATTLDPSPELSSSIVGVGTTTNLGIGIDEITYTELNQTLFLKWGITIYNNGPDRVDGFALRIESCGAASITVAGCSGTCPFECSIPTPIDSGTSATVYSDSFDAGWVATVRSDATTPYYETDPTNNTATAFRPLRRYQCGLLGIETLLVGLVVLLRGRRGRRAFRRIFGGAAAGLVVLASLTAAPESAHATALVLSVDSSASHATVAIASTLGSPPPVAVSMSGSADVDVTLGSDALFGLTAESLQLTGGALAFSDVSILLSSPPLYELTFAGNGVGASLSGPLMSGFAVAPGLSLFDLVGSLLSFDTGTITAMGTYYGTPVNEPLDFAATPFTSLFPLNSLAELQIADLGGGNASVRLLLPFTAPLHVSIDSEPVTVTIAGTLALNGVLVPEPASALLVASGLLGLGWLARRRSPAGPVAR